MTFGAAVRRMTFGTRMQRPKSGLVAAQRTGQASALSMLNEGVKPLKPRTTVNVDRFLTTCSDCSCSKRRGRRNDARTERYSEVVAQKLPVLR